MSIASRLISTVPVEKGRSFEKTFLAKAYQAYARTLNAVTPLRPSDRPYDISLSEEHKFMWFRVYKVGTRTIFRMLDENGVALNADHTGRIMYPQKLYREYFKFAFVRNPWDRLASAWRNRVRDYNEMGAADKSMEETEEFRSFLDKLRDLDLETCNHHFRLQTALVDLNHLDFLGRFERFDDDLAHVADRLGLTYTKGKKIHASKSVGHYSKYYDDETRDLVARLYERDIRMLNYEF